MHVLARPALTPRPPGALPPHPPRPGGRLTAVRAKKTRPEAPARPSEEEADGAPATPTPPPLPPSQPAAPADAVAAASATAATVMLILATGVRALAVPLAPLIGHDPAAVADLTSWAPSFSPTALAGALATAAAVTAARAALAAASPSFAASTATSNAAVLPNLSVAQATLWAAAVPALAEELLFRGAVLPAAAPDWRGAAVAAAAFGALHVGGGRGPGFAAWATGVGLAYGALALATGDVWACVAAHALANGAAAGLWWVKEQETEQQHWKG